ncbi:NPCBM/NEW2 domain-containing protein [Mucilaginibacter sp.]|uniref:NPCBM/NEW2 domain-containing protein n=1 Tax=Mucilaginibacter sp. TaxID=1882438 RepID=UPI0025E7B2BB|nr:NPCBM/NEW2 domain-containing protein [Mucilaginibacter sp.]
MIKKYALLLFIVLISENLAKAQGQNFPLSALNTDVLTQQVFSPAVNQSMTGQGMKIGGKVFNDGISVHAPFSGFLYLGGKGLRFVADVGVDDKENRNLSAKNIQSIANSDGTQTYYLLQKAGDKKILVGIGTSLKEISPGSVVFILKADGKEIWNSGVIKQGQKAVHVDVDISGVQTLGFSVSDAGDGISGDVANWANASVTVKQYFKPTLVDENYAGNTKSVPMASKQLTSALLKLPVYHPAVTKTDWLLKPPAEKAQISRFDENQIVMSNGLVSRTFYLSGNLACTSIKNLVSGEEYLRDVEPEANLLIDSINYPVGGLTGQVDKAYLLPKWLPKMRPIPNAFVLTSFETIDLKPQLYSPVKRWEASSQWHSTGKEVIFHYTHPALKNISVSVHYQLFDGLPLIAKWLEITNKGAAKITVNHFESEIIAYHEPLNSPMAEGEWLKPNFYIENEYAFGGFTYESSDQSIFWQTDKTYTSQADYSMRTPCVVKSMPKIGPQQQLAQNETLNTFRTYVLALDGTDRERNGLSQRKMYRTLAPWATENPIFLHLTSTDPKVVKQAIDQCKATGYEMVIFSFGSGLNMEDTTTANLNKFKELTNYAHSKGIEVGGYSLFSSRSIDADNDAININTGKPGGTKFGNAPCLGSKWGIDYLKKLNHFFSYTGFDMLEHDGPYPGDFCASINHPGHKGYGDSQWNQWKQSIIFYESLRAKGIYMNLPDFYFLSGSNKTGIGYKEVNWSLPREQQLVLGRQNNYDGTWTRTPSMNWTFVPLVEYHGGGKAATLEPLSEHLDTYKAHMVQNYGAGIQACYRGNRLYDTDATRNLVTAQITHYKKYRDILNADIVHLQRPTGRDWDGFIHVDPQLKQKAYAMFFNPLDTAITREVKLPLYYTGLKNNASIAVEGDSPKLFKLDNQGNVTLQVSIPANGNTWLLVE